MEDQIAIVGEATSHEKNRRGRRQLRLRSRKTGVFGACRIESEVDETRAKRGNGARLLREKGSIELNEPGFGMALRPLLLACAAMTLGCGSGASARRGGPEAPVEGARVADVEESSAVQCKALSVEKGKSVAGYLSDVFVWSDADCRTRSAALVHNDTLDPANEFGGYARRFTYEFGGKVRTCEGTGAGGWQGFGYIVAHYADTAETTKNIRGTFSTPLAGKHHALHEYRWRIHPGGDVDVIVEWFFATGRSNPVYAITLDSTRAGPDVVSADTRAPYGDVGWDMNLGANVDGVGWGDKYKLTTTGSGPLTPDSSWDYTTPNVVPYDVAWSSGVDAEMGAVATLAWETRNAGGDYGNGTLSTKWGKTGTKLLDPTNLPDWLWPFQINQWELPFVTTSKRLAWGLSYGAVGRRKVDAFGKSFSGYPYQSYSVYVVLGAHSAHAVDAQITEIETVQHTILSASVGAVATDGPAGLSRNDRQSYTPKGFNPIYGVWEVSAQNDAAALTFDVTQGTLTNPLVLLTSFAANTAPAHVRLGGRELAADSDYFMTIDAAAKRLWLTLNTTLRGKTDLVVGE